MEPNLTGGQQAPEILWSVSPMMLVLQVNIRGHNLFYMWLLKSEFRPSCYFRKYSDTLIHVFCFMLCIQIYLADYYHNILHHPFLPLFPSYVVTGALCLWQGNQNSWAHILAPIPPVIGRHTAGFSSSIFEAKLQNPCSILLSACDSDFRSFQCGDFLPHYYIRTDITDTLPILHGD